MFLFCAISLRLLHSAFPFSLVECCPHACVHSQVFFPRKSKREKPQKWPDHQSWHPSDWDLCGLILKKSDSSHRLGTDADAHTLILLKSRSRAWAMKPNKPLCQFYFHFLPSMWGKFDILWSRKKEVWTNSRQTKWKVCAGNSSLLFIMTSKSAALEPTCLQSLECSTATQDVFGNL